MHHPPRARRTASYALLVLLLVPGALPLLSVPPAHAARTLTIELTFTGPEPESLTAAVGDSIVFRNSDPAFVHQAQSSSPNWRFDTGPLAPGEQVKVATLTRPGEYLYEGANLDRFSGRVVVPAPSPAPSPARTSAPPSPSPRASPPPPSAAGSPAASPSPTGCGGVIGPPLLGGGLPSPTAGGPPPDIAPVLPGAPTASASPSGPTIAVAPGRLPEPATARRYGLPAALATVAAAGVASLLVRLLLAHPAAARRRQDSAAPGGGSPVTVD